MKKMLLIASLFLFLMGCVQQQISQTDSGKVQIQGSYKVGVMYPLSGDAAAYGIPIQRVTRIAVDEINSKGGINGKKIELIHEDSKCNPKDGNSAAQKLINIDKVEAIIGGVCSGETLGAAPIAEANKVVMISPSATSPDITTAGDFIFRLAPSDAYAGIVASDYAYNELRARRAAVISESTDYAQGLRKVFKENFVKLGGKIVADETYNPEDIDFRTQVTKAKAAKPDVVYVVPQTPPKGLLLVKQINELGLDTKLLTAEVLIGRNVVAENAKEMEGVIGVEQKFDETGAKSSNLLAKYEAEAKEKAPFPAYMSAAYDIVYVLADAIGKNGYDGEKIKDYLYGVKDYNGAVGIVSIDKNGDVILDFAVKEVKNGKLVSLK